MKQSLRLALVFVFGAIAALAARDDVPLEFTRLDLKDGRKLKNVVVKSYDAASGKVLLIANKKAFTVSIDLIPLPFAEQLKVGAPAAGASVATIAAPPVATRQKIGSTADQYSGERGIPGSARTVPTVRIERPTRMTHPPAPTTPSFPAALPAASAEMARQEAEAHREVALGRAENYYRFEHRAGSDNIKVTVLSIDALDPKAVEGWKGRYRTEGKVFLEFYDSIHGGSFQRATSTFEVMTQRKADESKPVVESFTRKS